MSDPSDVRRSTRRQLLRGAGGFTLALPVLPSLLTPREARAAETRGPIHLVQFQSDHGGAAGANMFPADQTLTDTLSYGGHLVRRGALRPARSAGKASLSPILTADEGVLTDKLAAKINVIRGLDVPFYIAHNTGLYLGNYAANDGNGSDGIVVQKQSRPTIDQLLAWSRSFYGGAETIRERFMHIGEGGRRGLSWTYSNPQARTGEIQPTGAAWSATEWFNRIFVPNAPVDARAPVVDRVLQDYLRLRNGNRRLSTPDRHRLDDYMQRLSEIERRLKVRVSCGGVQAPAKDSFELMRQPSFYVDLAMQAEAQSLVNDVIVAAFICGTSRIAVVQQLGHMSDFKGDWHQDIAHKHWYPAEQQIMVDAYRAFFEKAFLDLANKLEAVTDATGRTLLDQSLVTWSHECGWWTHESQSIPVVAAGSAGGFLKTGQYCDYRNLNRVANPGGYMGGTEVTWSGLIYNQWLGTVMQAMGMPKSEYERDGVGGYGVKYIGEGQAALYPNSVFSVMSDVLPFLKA
ncbi:MAG TPA: DUF1552 domain-containing protein [Myxococcaceae bacterium]|nr:DUF1552 domain-containing protein [Myxococcaceae bacterium]